MGFVVYDVETSGLNKRFDQILQFAAIQTDNDLNPVDRVDLRCRLQPNVIPSPHALHVTGMDFDDLIQAARPSHYAIVCQIHAILQRWSPSIFLGFNSIRFDEEFLRQALYHCLHPLFLTNTNGNSRADVLKLARAAATLHPNLLNVPLDASGRRVFRLGTLAQVNGIVTANAHDAMSDVEVTLALCRKIRTGAPDLWSSFNRFANKAAVQAFLQDEEAFGLFEFAGGRQDVLCVTPVGRSTADANVHYCVDLTADVDGLRQMSHEELVSRLRTQPRPVHKLKVNASPLLCHLWELGGEHLGGLTEADLTRGASRIRSDTDFQGRLTAAAAAIEHVYPSSDHVEEQIYSGFVSDGDWATCRQFHAAPWEERLEIARRITDPRLRRLAQRLFLFERPDLLQPLQRTALEAEVERRLCCVEQMPWLTIRAALDQLDQLQGDSALQLDLASVQRFRNHLSARLQRAFA